MKNCNLTNLSDELSFLDVRVKLLNTVKFKILLIINKLLSILMDGGTGKYPNHFRNKAPLSK